MILILKQKFFFIYLFFPQYNSFILALPYCSQHTNANKPPPKAKNKHASGKSVLLTSCISAGNFLKLPVFYDICAKLATTSILKPFQQRLPSCVLYGPVKKITEGFKRGKKRHCYSQRLTVIPPGKR